jgi:hypothetical protein
VRDLLTGAAGASSLSPIRLVAASGNQTNLTGDIRDMAPTHPTQPLSAPPTSRSRPPWPLLVVILLLVFAVAVIALHLTSGDDGTERVAIPLAGRDTAVVHIDSGADSIVVGTADLAGDLAVVTTPGGHDSGVQPRARMDGDQLRVWTEDVGDPDDGAAVQIDVRIARGVRWDVVVDKGAKQIRLGLGSGQVNSVELRGGADLADITLPKPVGEQAVRIPTGLATANVHLPAGVPTKLTFGSGAGRAIIDGAQRQGIAAGLTIFGANGKGGKGGEKGYAAAKDRVLIDVSAGVGTLSVDRAQSPS